MIKYLLFTGERFDNVGGMNEFKGVFDTIDQAKELIENSSDDFQQWAQIVDHRTMKIVLEGDRETVHSSQKTTPWEWELEWEG